MLKTLEKLQNKLKERDSGPGSDELNKEIAELNSRIKRFAESKNNGYLLSVVDGVEKKLREN